MRILIAVDGSRYSEAAVNSMKALRIGKDAEVTLLTVIPEHVFPGGRTLAELLGRSTALKRQLRRVEEEEASELLTRLSQRIAGRGVKVETVIRRGSPADGIIKACRSIGADMVLVGPKGMSDAREFSLGGVAHKVIKYAPCSVLVAREDGKAVDRVLVPVDGSGHSDEMVRFLLQLPLPRQTEVIVITVLQPFASALVRAYTVTLEGNRQVIADLREAEEEAAVRLVEEAEGRFREAGYRVSGIVARGDPSQEILRYAAQRDVDLIALGARGLTGVRGFLLGSVAHRVARYAGTSVLTVRPPKR